MTRSTEERFDPPLGRSVGSGLPVPTPAGHRYRTAFRLVPVSTRHFARYPGADLANHPDRHPVWGLTIPLAWPNNAASPGPMFAFRAFLRPVAAPASLAAGTASFSKALPF